MIVAERIWAAPPWALPLAGALALAAVLLVTWSYWSGRPSSWGRRGAGLLKTLGMLALAACLLDPLWSGTRPRPGANLFVVLADNSRSMQIRDGGRNESRGQYMKRLLQSANWELPLVRNFDLRRYIFDDRLRAVEDFSALGFDGTASSLASSLQTIARRYHGRPIAGVHVLTDGNSTDEADNALDANSLPPIYPVMFGQEAPARDIRVAGLSVNQTNFEAAPVTIRAEISCQGYDSDPLVIQLVDESGKEVQRQVAPTAENGKSLVHRFQFRPSKKGISFYEVRAFARSEENQWNERGASSEATLSNNSRQVMVDRGGGPYRVLYVSGRPNWEFNYLRRAIDHDEEVHLVGLIRVAKREPKFTFRGRDGQRTNPIYRGFDTRDEQAESYDEPVLLRLNTEDPDQLRDGFPKVADELFRYHAIVIDDVEAGFFTHDQMTLIEQFVSQRGGGLLMLGGQESFLKGNYHRTPIAAILPVSLDGAADFPSGQSFELALAREGWVQPWVRLRSTEPEERKRLAQMPLFKTLNPVQNIKPGAAVLAQVKSSQGREYPALIVQRYGKGRSASVLVGDLWRWQLAQKSTDQDDLATAWRQTVRWLVADVPQPVEAETRRAGDQSGRPFELTVTVHDKTFEPLDNATVRVSIKTPENRQIELSADASGQRAGLYEAAFLPPGPGLYRAQVKVTAPDGSDVGECETGWVSQPALAEFDKLEPNRRLLEQLATGSGGEMVSADRLDRFVRSLPRRRVPVVEPWIYPLWHRWTVFVFAVMCFVGEWGWRRWRGLP